MYSVWCIHWLIPICDWPAVISHCVHGQALSVFRCIFRQDITHFPCLLIHTIIHCLIINNSSDCHIQILMSRDRKRKKFVTDPQDGKAKKVQTESGNWIPASYQSNIYPYHHVSVVCQCVFCSTISGLLSFRLLHVTRVIGAGFPHGRRHSDENH